MHVCVGILLLAAIDIISACVPAKEGCFKHSGSDEYLLHSDKSEHAGESFHSGKSVDWNNFEAYLKDAVCRCEKAAAEKGFKYISFRYFGVCHGLKQLPKEKSEFCVHHSFEQCMKSHDRCVGADDAEYVYRVTLKLQTSNPVSTPVVHRNIFCEHKGWRHITCKNGEVIRIIKAFYGRSSKEHCGYASYYNLKCRSAMSEGAIKSTCDGRQTCALDPNNRYYGDPCVYTVKYIDVEHVCIKKTNSEPIKSEPRKAIMCEHQSWKSFSCSEGEVIEVIYGYYGRKSLSHCGSIRWYNTNCESKTSAQMIKSICNGKQRCTLLPSNWFYGDPCRHTVKYIEVDYRCVRILYY